MSRPAHPPRDAERGVILVNVLVILALASTVVLIMIAFQDTAILRTQRFSEAAQAASYASGGEASAIAALRRDAAEAPDSDSYAEPWAALAENEAPVEGGTFSLAITDAQARFNLNNVEKGGLTAQQALKNIIAILELPPGSAELIIRRIAEDGPLTTLDELRGVGFSSEQLETLATLAVVLPGQTPINLNTAPEPLIAIALGNPVAAHSLVSRRERQGMLTEADIKTARVILPRGAGFTSRYFIVDTQVRIGDVTQTLSSLLQRRMVDGRPVVAAIARARNAPLGPVSQTRPALGGDGV